MKVARETFAKLSTDELIDIVFALDGTLRALNVNNVRLMECMPSAKEVAEVQSLFGSWAMANALAIQGAQEAITAAFADTARTMN
jgi:hypothetical protein